MIDPIHDRWATHISARHVQPVDRQGRHQVVIRPETIQHGDERLQLWPVQHQHLRRLMDFKWISRFQAQHVSVSGLTPRSVTANDLRLDVPLKKEIVTVQSMGTEIPEPHRLVLRIKLQRQLFTPSNVVGQSIDLWERGDRL